MAGQLQLHDDTTPTPAAQTGVVPVVPARRDLAGHTVDLRPEPGCRKHTWHTASVPVQPCPIPEQAHHFPLALVLVGAILIVAGALTAMGKGPGALIRLPSRSRRARQRARIRRRRIGIALVFAGLIGWAMIFV